MSKKCPVRTMFTMTLAIGVALASVAIVYRIISKWLSQGYPEARLIDPVVYMFDPDTILASIEEGKTNMFFFASENRALGTPAPSGLFPWKQADYLKIADVLHRFVWKEPLSDWHLYWAEYSIWRCQDGFNGFDDAAFLFYKRQNDKYIAHHMFIRPRYKEVIVANDRYPYTGRWKDLDLDKVKVSSADEALKIAEEKGGRKARLAAKNECYIGIYLAPGVFEHKILFCPVCYVDWGWDVTYWHLQNDSFLLFDITIDAFTGKYEPFQRTNRIFQ